MHLTVGYLATPTGDDGVALASALAKTFDADVDVVLVVREEFPDGHPGRAEYQQLLVERGEEWVSRAIDRLAANGVSASSTVTVGESFAESLIDFAEQKSSDLIVVGGARDGFFGGHTIGPVTGALLHSLADPGRAGAARLRRGSRRRVHRRHGRGAHQARRRQPAAVRDHAGQRGRPGDPDAVAGVGGEPGRGRERQGGAPTPGRRRRGESARSPRARCRTRPRSIRWSPTA